MPQTAPTTAWEIDTGNPHFVMVNTVSAADNATNTAPSIAAVRKRSIRVVTAGPNMLVSSLVPRDQPKKQAAGEKQKKGRIDYDRLRLNRTFHRIDGESVSGGVGLLGCIFYMQQMIPQMAFQLQAVVAAEDVFKQLNEKFFGLFFMLMNFMDQVVDSFGILEINPGCGHGMLHRAAGMADKSIMTWPGSAGKSGFSIPNNVKCPLIRSSIWSKAVSIPRISAEVSGNSISV
jgi:hypothetical protein